MPGLSDIVEIVVTNTTVLPTREGFGRACVMAYHTAFPELYRVYTSADDMVTDGFTTRSAAYRMVSALFNQNPRPVDVVVGRLPAAHTHTVTLTMLSAVQGQYIRFKCLRPTDGVEVQIEYLIGAAETTTTVATAVELLVEAIAGVNSTSAGAVITATPVTNGDMLYFYDFENVSVADTTADAAYDTALTALDNATPPAASWYYVLIDVASKANIDKVAAWAQTRIKAFFPTVINTAERDGASTIGGNLKTLAYTRTVPWYHPHLHEYLAAAVVGMASPRDAGAFTLALKSLLGVSTVLLTATHQTNLDTAGLNYYQAIKGLSLTDGPNGGGTTSQGQYFDIIHGTDWFTEELQTEVLAYLAGLDKAPYTDATGDILENLGLAVGARGVDRNLFVAGTLACDAPLVSTISAVQRAARQFGDIKFSATLAGAIHKAKFRATLSI